MEEASSRSDVRRTPKVLSERRFSFEVGVLQP